MTQSQVHPFFIFLFDICGIAGRNKNWTKFNFKLCGALQKKNNAVMEKEIQPGFTSVETIVVVVCGIDYKYPL